MEPAVADLQAKLSQHKSQLAKVEQLLLLKPEDETLKKLRDDLQQVITLTLELTTVKASKGEEEIQLRKKLGKDTAAETIKAEADDVINDDQPARVWHVGERCMAKYPGDGNLYCARIDSIDTDTCTVTFMDYGSSSSVPIRNIRPYVTPPTEKLKAGTKVRAVWEQDGIFYDATIDEITPKGMFAVTFSQYGNKGEVTAYDIQIPKASSKKRSAEGISDESGASGMLPDKPVIPEKMKYLPTDTEEDKLAKKKRIKALKSRHRTQKMEQERNNRQSAWQDFNSKGVPGKKKESIFKSPDSLDGKVGVVGSGRGMTENKPREKVSFTSAEEEAEALAAAQAAIRASRVDGPYQPLLPAASVPAFPYQSLPAALAGLPMLAGLGRGGPLPPAGRPSYF